MRRGETYICNTQNPQNKKKSYKSSEKREPKPKKRIKQAEHSATWQQCNKRT